MGKRYYCDYCDRSFKDAQGARQKHLSSLQHVNNYDDHYRLFKDPETILEEQSKKILCIRFAKGDCAFGHSCKYSHFTSEMVSHYKNIVMSKQQLAKLGPNPEEIAKKFFEASIYPEIVEKYNFTCWALPTNLQNNQNLPPSLWPIKPDSLSDSNFSEWGAR